MLHISPASSWPLHLVHLVPKIKSPYLENGVMFACLGSVRCSRIDGSPLQLVHVRVTEYDRAPSNYLEPLHMRKVARAVERQLKLMV